MQILKTLELTCRKCDQKFAWVRKRGRRPIYCSAGCRQRAYETRQIQQAATKMMLDKDQIIEIVKQVLREEYAILPQLGEIPEEAHEEAKSVSLHARRKPNLPTEEPALRDEFVSMPKAEEGQLFPSPSRRKINLPIAEEELPDEFEILSDVKETKSVSPRAENTKLPTVKQALRAALSDNEAEDSNTVTPRGGSNDPPTVTKVARPAFADHKAEDRQPFSPGVGSKQPPND